MNLDEIQVKFCSVKALLSLPDFALVTSFLAQDMMCRKREHVVLIKHDKAASMCC